MYFICSKNTLRLCFALLMAMMLAGVSILSMPISRRAYAQSPACSTSNNATGGYTITLCITAPANGATLVGDVPVVATYTVSFTGVRPGIKQIAFGLNGEYVLTGYPSQSPFTFTLPTAKFANVTSVPLTATLSTDDVFTTSPASLIVSLSNPAPPGPGTFTPATGTSPSPGNPFVVAAVGDGASGEITETAVVNLISSWNPNMFLYLGDVYEKGSVTEFYNWYGSASSSFYGKFKNITNPTAGIHEYLLSPNPTLPYTPTGYVDYWGQGVNWYYSFNAGGWHFVSLNTNCLDVGGCKITNGQYMWLVNDLATDTSACTLVYYHTPLYSQGPEATSPLTDTWTLMAQKGVDIVLNGNDHNYQRWKPLDDTGNVVTVGITGTTEFVVGTGGHSLQNFSTTDPRMAVGFDKTATPPAYGALKLELYPTMAVYRFFNTANQQLDAGTIMCSGAHALNLPLIEKH